MQYTPHQNKRPAAVTALSLAFISVTMLIASVTLKNSSAVLSVLLRTLAFITVFISSAVVTRYLSFTYTYVLEDSDLVIMKNTSGRQYAVCRMDYTAIKSIATFKEAKKRIKGIHKINYSLSFNKNLLTCLFYEQGGDSGVILFEPDKIFLNALEKNDRQWYNSYVEKTFFNQPFTAYLSFAYYNIVGDALWNCCLNCLSKTTKTQDPHR